MNTKSLLMIPSLLVGLLLAFSLVGCGNYAPPNFPDGKVLRVFPSP